MLTLPSSVRIYVAVARTDMRKSFNGLAGLVRDEIKMDPKLGHLFVFIGKRGDKIKVLWWNRDGWSLFYRRLEKGTFRLPQAETSASSSEVEIDATQLSLILDGIDLQKTSRQRRWACS